MIFPRWTEELGRTIFPDWVGSFQELVLWTSLVLSLLTEQYLADIAMNPYETALELAEVYAASLDLDSSINGLLSQERFTALLEPETFTANMVAQP